MIEKGRVLNDLEDGKVEIIVDGEGCGQCGQKGHCSLEQSNLKLIALNKAKAKIGDQVEIEMSESFRIFLAFLFFIVPILFLFMGFGLGSWLGERFKWNWSVWVFCLSSFIGSFGLIYWISQYLKDRLPVVRMIICPKEHVNEF